MKSFIVVLMVGIFIFLGILLSLIAIYAAPDEQAHFAEAGYFFWFPRCTW